MSDTVITTTRTTEKFSLKIQVKQDDGVYVASVPELNISARGGSEADARKQVAEALKQFFENSKRAGTLQKTIADLQSKTKAKP